MTPRAGDVSSLVPFGVELDFSRGVPGENNRN
jgi:hypothetical protein